MAPLEGEMLRPLVLTLLELGEYDEAENIVRAAMAQAPACYDSLFCAGLTYQKLHRPLDALACYDRARVLRPGDAELHNNRAIALQDLGRFADAFASYDEALSLSPDYPLARFHRSLACLALGDFEPGWRDYESRLLGTDVAARSRLYPRWHGENIEERTILAYGEQGLGDEIMFASCLPDLIAAAGRCIIECAPRLQPLFKRSFPDAVVYAASDDKQVPDAVSARRRF